MGVDLDEQILAEVDAEILNTSAPQDYSSSIEDGEETRKGEFIRDSIDASMWVDYIM